MEWLSSVGAYWKVGWRGKMLRGRSLNEDEGSFFEYPITGQVQACRRPNSSNALADIMLQLKR
jgi:hypothetical protein